jgi:hypothetical protein
MACPSSCIPRQTSFLWSWACALTACFISPVQVTSSDAAGIALAYVGAPYEDLMSIADAHCRQFGKQAWPTENTTVGDAYHHLQKFECRVGPPRQASAAHK